MNAHLQRGMMLVDQGRFDMAEKEIRLSLAEEPDDAIAHSMLAICLSELEKFDAAVDEARQAIHLEPDNSFTLYAYSLVLADRHQFVEATDAMRSAIELDPYEVRYFSQLARLEFSQRRWQAALEAAEKGLELDPEHVQCTNWRAMSLIKLGRKMEATASLESALQNSPEDEFSHANMGWSLLEQNQYDKAMEHFREALRINPELEWARAGIVEAMRARYFLYRVMLNWFLWMIKLQRRSQWGVILGMYIGFRVISGIARNTPSLAPYLTPLLIVYVGFALLTWTAVPMFNLVLRTNRFGRLALSADEIRTSTWVGLCVAAAGLLVVTYFFSGAASLLVGAIACMLIVAPLSRIDACSPGWPRSVIVLVTIALGGLGALITVLAVTAQVVGGNLEAGLAMAVGLLLTPFLYGAIAAQFGVNFLVAARPMRGTNRGRQVWLVGLGVLAVASIGLLALVGSCIAAAYR